MIMKLPWHTLWQFFIYIDGMIRIETERLLMRDLQPGDEYGLYELDSDAEVHQYLGNKPVQHIDECRKVIELINKQYADYGIGRWAVIEKATGNFTGWGGLKWMDFEVNGHTHYYDVGYRFIKQYWGRGYASEVAQASVQYAMDVLKTTNIHALAHTGNAASRRVLEKAGLQWDGAFNYEEELHDWFSYPK